MEWLTMMLMVAYGGSFGDNVGIKTTAYYEDTVGASVGVGYAKYLSVTAGPAFRVDVGESSNLVLKPQYGYDYDSAGSSSLSSHTAMFSISLQSPVDSRVSMEAELVPVKYPFDVNTEVDGDSRDVPHDATDSSLFLPGIGIGWSPPLD